MFHLISAYLSVGGIVADHAVAHGGEPEPSLGVDLDIHDHQMVVVRVFDPPILERVGVDASAALTIRADPDAAVAALRQCHHGGGIAFQQMPHEGAVLSDDVYAVLVSTYPGTVLVVDEYADDTGGADDVAHAAELEAHILEAVKGDGLTVETLLEQTEPEVAVAVLDDGVNLALGEVDLLAEKRVVDELVLLRVVDGDALAVVADDDTIVAVAVERRHALAARGSHMYEVHTLLTPSS